MQTMGTGEKTMSPDSPDAACIQTRARYCNGAFSRKEGLPDWRNPMGEGRWATAGQGSRGWALLSLCLATWLIGSLPAQETLMTRPRYEIAYASYFGGSDFEEARETIPYPDGSVLVGGGSRSADLPTTAGVLQPTYGSARLARSNPEYRSGDCFLLRLSADGSRMLQATYFGGSKQERPVYGMELDSEGNIVIASATRSTDLPVTTGCFCSEYRWAHNGFAAKLSADFKQLLWCTYLGFWPRGGLALDGRDNVCIVGSSYSPDFPTTEGVVQPKMSGTMQSVILKLTPDGKRPIFSTFFGGGVEEPPTEEIPGVRVDAEGSIYVGGHTRSPNLPVTEGSFQANPGGESDAFLAKLSSDASRVLYATYLGGNRHEFAEHRLFLDQDGTVLLVGATASPDFPTTEGAFQRRLGGQSDGFLAKLSADGKKLLFSTFFGGSGRDFLLMPTPDAEGNIFVVGSTGSPDLPTTPDALQRNYGGGEADGVLALFSPDGAELIYATYLGGSGDELIRSLALGPRGEMYLVGKTSSKDFPVTPGAFQTKYGGGDSDAFVVELVPTR